jgi:hypothetical protein
MHLQPTAALEEKEVHGRSAMVVISMQTLSPLVALVAGGVILFMPRTLNYVVALYLIIVGLLGIAGH